MQCPPMPGPGVNFMKPNGFVAAASITSQTSTPSLSQTIAISLTSADVDRAEGVLEQLHQLRRLGATTPARSCRCTPRRAPCATSVHAGVMPPTTFGVFLVCHTGLPGIDALGAEREEDVLADRAARPSCMQRHRAARAWCPDRSCSRARRACPGARLARDGVGGGEHVAHVRIARLGERRRHGDGDRVAARRGVGSSVVASKRPRFTTCSATSSAGTSWMCDSPAFSRSHDPLADVVADDLEAGLRELHGERQADVPEADDADDGGLRSAILRSSCSFMRTGSQRKGHAAPVGRRDSRTEGRGVSPTVETTRPQRP